MSLPVALALGAVILGALGVATGTAMLNSATRVRDLGRMLAVVTITSVGFGLLLKAAYELAYA